MKPKPIFSACDIDGDVWRIHHTGYVVKTVHSEMVKGKRETRIVSAHRMVLSKMLGRPLLRSEFCDHINFVRHDNRRENLRLVTMQQNNQHRKANRVNKTGMRGVFFNKEKSRWVATATINGKVKYGGHFSKPEDAGKAASMLRTKLGFFGE